QERFPRCADLGRVVVAERAQCERGLRRGETGEPTLGIVERVAGAQELERPTHLTVDTDRQQQRGRRLRALRGAPHAFGQALEVRLVLPWHLLQREPRAGELRGERL